MPVTGKRIDVHHHILPPEYVESVGATTIGSQGSSGRIPAWSEDGSLDLMDAAGIDAAIVSVSSPGVATLDAAEAAALARRCNDIAADMVTRHPSRFGMFATIPLYSVDAALAEVEYALGALGADGVCLLSNYGGRYLGDPALRPLHEDLAARDAVVFVHPTTPVNAVDVAGMAPSMLEFTFDTTRTIASLLVSGVLTAHPSIRWIFSHAGGAMPYLAGRLEVLLQNNARLREAVGGEVREALRGLYFDTALSADDMHFAALRRLVPDSQILFGTDYPFGPPDQMAGTVGRVDALDLPPAVTAAIYGGNAAALFPRLAAELHGTRDQGREKAGPRVTGRVA
jgi:6-methylsalicylate decarboxylase